MVNPNFGVFSPTKVFGRYTVADRLQILSKQDPKRQILDHVEGSKIAFKNQREKWINHHNSYHGSLKKNSQIKGRANLHYRKLFSQIETETARFVLSYFANRPYATTIPTNASTVASAKKMEDCLQFYFEHCPVFYLSRQKMVKYTLIYGTGYTVPSWRTEVRAVKKMIPVVMYGANIGYEEITQDEVIYDGLWFDTYSPDSVFPYPWPQNGVQMPRMVVEEFIHIDELVQRAKDQAFDLKQVMKIPLNAAGQDDADFKRKMAAIGRNDVQSDPDMVRCLHSFSKHTYQTLANDEILIRDEDAFLEHGEIPVIMGIKTLDPDSYSPISTAELLLPHEKVYNALKNSSLDYVISNLWPTWKYRAGHINPNYLLSVPNNRIPVEHMDDVDIIRMPELKMDILALINALGMDFEDITGYYAQQKGAPRGGAAQTLGSDQIFNEQGNMRIQFNVQNMERFTFKPEAKQCASLITQFMKPGTEMRIHGPAGYQYQKVTPEEIRGEYDFQVSGGSEVVNRAVIQQQLVNFFAIANQATQFVRLNDGQVAPVPLVDTYNYIHGVMQGWDKTLADKVLYRPELWGIPITNDMLSEYNMPQIPGLEGMHQQQATGARSMSPFPQGGRSLNPNQIAQGPNKQVANGQRLI